MSEKEYFDIDDNVVLANGKELTIRELLDQVTFTDLFLILEKQCDEDGSTLAVL